MADQRDAPNGLPYQPNLRQGFPSTYLKDVYKPLMHGQVRFLELRGLGDGGVLHCKLVHKKLLADNAKPKYAAISYTWNPKERVTYGKYAADSKHIILDGLRTRVPHKAATILRLMLENRRRRIWIDALCINQSDPTEKASQVSMMGDIYRTANEVAIILGPPTDDTDRFLDSLKEAGTGSLLPTSSYEDLHKNSYWFRAWTLQEVSLATSANIFCGSRVVSFQSYYNFRERFETDLVSESIALTDKGAIGKDDHSTLARGQYQAGLHFKNHEAPFLELLRETRFWHGCLDPRDKLYSRMSLAHDAKTLIPHIDYRSSTEAVFKGFAVRCILSTGSLEVITFTNRTKMALPSWVPDWSIASEDWNSRNQRLIEAIQAIAWAGKSALRISLDDQTLTAQGMILETISASYTSILKCLVTRFTSGALPKDTLAWREIPHRGDFICVLQGCNTLVFLRKLRNHYTMVGKSNPWHEMVEGGFFPDSKISQMCSSPSPQFNDGEEHTFEIR